MSCFLSPSASELKPYTPGEQPKNIFELVKLNTNESPYPPAPGVLNVLTNFDHAELRLYPDPDASAFRDAICGVLGVESGSVFVGGGSDEILGYAFMAFFERGDAVLFPDVTYGFYPVHAQLCGLASKAIPLREDFTVDVDDYKNACGHIVLANPNAPTGIALEPGQIEFILKSNPGSLLIVDEAYCDFSPESSCIGLLGRYDNLLIVRTLSKSYGLAGMRLGYALGAPDLIAGLNRIKYAFNPYNLDRISIAVGAAAVSDQPYVRETVSKLTAQRAFITGQLNQRGFEVLDSQTNFVFARHEKYPGRQLYEGLRENGVLVRRFDNPSRVSGFLRISMGDDGGMRRFLNALDNII